jgi:hypothetical protein
MISLWKKIIRWFQYPARGSATNPCVFNSLKEGDRWIKEGQDVRYGHGTFSNKPHQWAERFDPRSRKWLLCHDTTWNCYGNYPVACYPEYKVIWYGYDERNKKSYE